MIPNLTDLHIPNDKKLSRGEQEYLRRLLSGLDNQMLTAAEWLGTPEAKEFFNTRQSEIREFFQESGIRQQLRDIIDYNAKDSDDLIKKFYQVGSQLGYRDIHKKLLYTPADKKALFHVTQYNFDLIRDLNNQLFEGIQETIFNTVAAGHGADVTTREILNLGIKPLPIKNEDGEVVRLISPRVRARMIARTEHARAVNTGTLQAYSNYGVEHVEIITVGDSDVCDICLDLADNNPYTLQEAMALLPAHPNCYGSSPRPGRGARFAVEPAGRGLSRPQGEAAQVGRLRRRRRGRRPGARRRGQDPAGGAEGRDPRPELFPASGDAEHPDRPLQIESPPQARSGLRPGGRRRARSDAGRRAGSDRRAAAAGGLGDHRADAAAPARGPRALPVREALPRRGRPAHGRDGARHRKAPRGRQGATRRRARARARTSRRVVAPPARQALTLVPIHRSSPF